MNSSAPAVRRIIVAISGDAIASGSFQSRGMEVDNTPIDYLDFASPVSGLGSKMGLDATHKWPGETQRGWGTTITMHAKVQQRMDTLLEKLGL